MKTTDDSSEDSVHVALVRAIATASRHCAAKEAIRVLQRRPSALSGEDSGLATVWLEFCAQVQGDHSVFWDAYELDVRQCIEGALFGMSDGDRQAMWLRTPAGKDWIEDRTPGEIDMPVNIDDLVEDVFNLVVQRAMDWEDENLRRFLCSGSGSFD